MREKRTAILAGFITFAVLLTALLWVGSQTLRENQQIVQPFPGDHTSNGHRHNESDHDSDPVQTVSTVRGESRPQLWYRNQVVVLAYHHVANDRTKPYAISPALFEQHMQFLRDHDLQPISLTEFLQFVETGELAVENAVLITFDDGYESFYRQAYPVLKRYGYPSVNFVIAGRLRDSAEQQREGMIPPLTLVQLQEMLGSGLVDVGSHTYSLHGQTSRQEWGTLPSDTDPVYQEEIGRLESEQSYRDRLYVDFVMSRVALSAYIKRPVEAISFPLGVTNSIIVQTAKEAGYRYAFTSDPGPVQPGVDPMAIPRYGVGTPDVDLERLRELFASVKTTR